MAISNEFQNRLNELVEDTAIKKTELAALIPVDYHTFKNALQYGIIPTTRILTRIADYFNVSFEYLLGKSDDDYFDKSENPSNFAERIKTLCEENDYSAYRVCHENHIDESYVSKWKKFGYFPDLEFLEILADYFDVSVDFLLGRTDYRK